MTNDGMMTANDTLGLSDPLEMTASAMLVRPSAPTPQLLALASQSACPCLRGGRQAPHGWCCERLACCWLAVTSDALKRA